MRTTATLLLIALFTSLQAQTPGDSLYMFFDDASDDLLLDSVYPAGCWQVGVPVKPVFTSAYSPGRALVTDTVLPHPENTTCYAEFKLIATDFNYLGRGVLFHQRRDMDSTTLASIEVRASSSAEWLRYGTGWPEELLINGEYQMQDIVNGYSMTGSSNGWEEVWIEAPCYGLFWNEGQRGMKWYDTEMHIRLVFESQSNTNGRDGWMIDNIRAGVSQCFGAIEEHVTPELTLSPNPADQYAAIRITGEAQLQSVELIAADGRIVHVLLTAADGQLVRSGYLPAPPVVLDVSDLTSGLYMLRARTTGGDLMSRLVVRH